MLDLPKQLCQLTGLLQMWLAVEAAGVAQTVPRQPWSSTGRPARGSLLSHVARSSAPSGPCRLVPQGLCPDRRVEATPPVASLAITVLQVLGVPVPAGVAEILWLTIAWRQQDLEVLDVRPSRRFSSPAIVVMCRCTCRKSSQPLRMKSELWPRGWAWAATTMLL